MEKRKNEIYKIYNMLKNKIITNNKTIKELSVVVNAFCVFPLGAMMNIERKSTSWDTSTEPQWLLDIIKWEMKI